MVKWKLPKTSFPVSLNPYEKQLLVRNNVSTLIL